MISNRLKELRQEKDLLQKDVATYLNISTSAYGFYEQGKRTPDSEMMKKLSEFFNVSLDYLLGKTDIRESADDILNGKEPTIALHSDYQYDELPDEAKKEIENFIEYVKAKYKK
ncbi:helix-turn-helix transcriptional regulator [Clostridium tertium]|uniref:helix-turn-helix domain-containing protein n=1 Tax=Clostridium tertium TaxID=1559 RepID=UPI0023305C93|nr:helix-turn-helix transcriptional regulator [Clostridium tertium]MDB1943713.1 helix-turn-helix transcriptional regulator [Clostridium tertium]MDB1951121.1 helix-turn-helix transcriptional regulator [Clostridium tertium]